MNRLLVRCLISATLTLSSIGFSAQNLSTQNLTQKIVGTAVEINKDKEFFYSEEDSIEIKDGHIQKIDSLYKNKDAKLIAEMHSDFTKKPYLPEINYLDHRRDVQYKMIYLEKENKVSVTQNFEDPKVTKSKKLDYVEDMTNSMGLINYIRENFSEVKKESKSFRYVVPALMDDFGMVLEFRENAESSDTNVQFAFRIKSFFIRNLSGIKESILFFDEKGTFIKGFNGVSNILSDANKPVDVQLTYTAPTETKTK